MMERLRKIISWFGKLGRKIITWFGELCRKIISWFGKLWRGIKSGFKKLCRKILTWFGKLWRVIQSLFRKLWHNKYVLGCMELSTPDEEIRQQYKLQRENGDWTLYQERVFIEQLFSTRFNYFLVAISFMVAAIVRITSPCTQLIVVFISAVILTIMSLVIYRAYVKLIIILKMIYRLEDYHVFRMVDNEVRALENKISGPVNHLLGVVVPLLGTLVFWGYFIFTLIRLLKDLPG